MQRFKTLVDGFDWPAEEPRLRAGELHAAAHPARERRIESTREALGPGRLAGERWGQSTVCALLTKPGGFRASGAGGLRQDTRGETLVDPRCPIRQLVQRAADRWPPEERRSGGAKRRPAGPTT